MTINTLYNGSYSYTLERDGADNLDFIFLASGKKSDMPSNPFWHSSVTFDAVGSNGSDYPNDGFHIINAPLVFGESTHSNNNDSGTTQLPESFIGQHSASQFSYIWNKGIGMVAGNRIRDKDGVLLGDGLFCEVWLGGTNNYLAWRPSGMGNFTLSDGHTYKLSATVRFRADGWLEVSGILYGDGTIKQIMLTGLGWNPAEYNALSGSAYLRSVVARTLNDDRDYTTSAYVAKSGSAWA